MSVERVQVNLPGGELVLETGGIARQADGAVVLRYRDNVLLATAVAAGEPRPGQGFFPLSVEYRERLAASGRIPGSWLRREGRITDREVLASRLADRSVRPLFPGEFLCETQLMVTVLSADEEVEPESLAITAGAAALAISDIPWNGPVAGVRIARVHGEWIVFPGRREREVADLDLVVSSGPAGLVMVEGQGREAPESQVISALERADRVARQIADAIADLAGRVGRPKRALPPAARDEDLASRIDGELGAAVREAVTIPGKRERRRRIAGILDEWIAAAGDVLAGREDEAREAYHALVARTIRQRIAREGKRIDGRGLADVRPISCAVSWLPRPHGSAIFTRGETQALVSCTLGTGRDEQQVETLEGMRSERFLLHYNFPPYSVGEVRPLRGPGRREIGHGNLAHRALEAVLPAPDDFPYTIRVVSDIAESNGSSSMATVCGASLALMDAGVPLRAPVAGIAMGLVREEGEFHVLTDILGDEDHLGDMDFKVAGTREGVTAIQMDNKLGSIPREVLVRALDQAREARLHVLDEMAKVLPAPRETLSPRAPRITSLRIRRERIRELIGPGGRNVQEIRAATGVEIDIGHDGLVRIYARDQAGAAEALRRIRHLTLEPEVGEVYRGEVIVVRDHFAIVRLGASVEGVLHVSEVDRRRIPRVGDVLSVGDSIDVRVLGVDERGRIRLSRREALP